MTETKTIVVVTEYTATVESRSTFVVPAELDTTRLGDYPILALEDMAGVEKAEVEDEIVSGSESNFEFVRIEVEP